MSVFPIISVIVLASSICIPTATTVVVDVVGLVFLLDFTRIAFKMWSGVQDKFVVFMSFRSIHAVDCISYVRPSVRIFVSLTSVIVVDLNKTRNNKLIICCGFLVQLLMVNFVFPIIITMEDE